MITISLTFLKSIEHTGIKVTFYEPQNVRSKEGKRLTNQEAKKDFRGHQVQSAREVSNLKTVNSFVGASTSASFAIGPLIIVVSSLFTNSLTGLSQFIQVIELCILMELFNFEFDPLVSNFLEAIREASGLDVLPIPLNEMSSGLHNSVAGVWKGKLSMIGSKPYLLQEIGYPGLFSMVIKFLLISSLNLNKFN